MICCRNTDAFKINIINRPKSPQISEFQNTSKGAMSRVGDCDDDDDDEDYHSPNICLR